MNKIDLHIHTNESLDADYCPKTIINMGKKAGLEIMAIADHDTVSGVKSAIQAGLEQDIKVVSAIEISCVYKDIELHILGYGIDVDNPIYKDLHNNVMDQEIKASKKRLQLIKDMGIYVNMNKLTPLISNDIIIGEIIGEASINEPENKDNPLIKPFLANGPLSDNPYVNFHWAFCAQNKPAYVAISLPNLTEVIEIIKQDKGIAIFAHPGNNIKEDTELLYQIMESGLDGLEAYSSYHNQNQIDYYIKHAEKNGWLITCGSDFHGKNKPMIQLGNINISKNHEDILIESILKL